MLLELAAERTDGTFAADGADPFADAAAGFGANGEVAARTNRSSKRFGGTATFVSASSSTTPKL